MTRLFGSFVSELFLPGEDIERLHDFEEECMEIYYREKENSMTSSTDQMMRQNTDTLVAYLFTIFLVCSKSPHAYTIY